MKPNLPNIEQKIGGVMLALTLLLSIGSPSVADDVELPTPDWQDSGIDTDAHIRVPGADNRYVPLPVGSQPNEYIYEARLACTDGDVTIFTECVAIMPDCAAGAGSDDSKPGTAIYWYFARTDATPPQWIFFPALSVSTARSRGTCSRR